MTTAENWTGAFSLFLPFILSSVPPDSGTELSYFLSRSPSFRKHNYLLLRQNCPSAYSPWSVHLGKEVQIHLILWNTEPQFFFLINPLKIFHKELSKNILCLNFLLRMNDFHMHVHFILVFQMLMSLTLCNIVFLDFCYLYINFLLLC